MFSLRKPSYSEIRDYLGRHQHVPFTYEPVECTRLSVPPRGFTRGENRVKLGTGRRVYLDAKKSLAAWDMFPREFVDLVWPTPIQTGRVVATLFQAPGFWALSPCRIVYTFEEIVETVDGSVERFGFAYGTVGDHLASGEERFTVEYNHSDESTNYEVLAYSKPHHWLSKAAYPYLRIQQARFRQLSGRSMQAAAAQARGSVQRDRAALSTAKAHHRDHVDSTYA